MHLAQIRKSINVAKRTVKAVAQKAKRQLFYLVRLLDENDNLVWSKIGTTTRSVEQRMKEHLRDYKKRGYNVARCDVQRVYDCGNLSAEGLESEFRAKYIKKYPELYVKTDRFKTEFDYEEAEKIVLNYLAANT